MDTVSPAAHLGYSQYQQLAANIGDDEQGLVQAARQFESMFLNMWLKSAREANNSLVGDGPFSSHELQTHQQMLDSEMAIHLSQSGGVGLADVIVKQIQDARNPSRPSASDAMLLTRMQARSPGRAVMPASPNPTPRVVSERYAAVATPGIDPPAGVRGSMFDSARAFVAGISPIVRRVASNAGFSVAGLVGQAALETGWGAHVMTDSAGHSTFNLFGIKADPSAADETHMVKVVSPEFEAGDWTQRASHFKAYDDFAQSIEDYVRLIQSSPRYTDALAKRHDIQAYFQALQEAGYATDPDYAEKILGLVQRVEDLAER